MDDFDNDMGLPDDEMIGESAGDVSDLGADLESEPDLGGGEPAAISRGSSGGQRQRVAAPAAPKKAPAKPKAKAKAKKTSAPKKKAAAAKKKAKPAKKSKGKAKAKPAAKKSKKKAGKKK